MAADNEQIMHRLVLAHAVLNGVIERIRSREMDVNPLVRGEVIADLQGVRTDISCCFEFLRKEREK